MEDTNHFDVVRFNGVEFNQQGMTLFSYESKVLSVSKMDIRQINLQYGFQSERPIVEVAFGILIIGLGIYFFIKFLLEISVNRIMYVDDLLSLLLLPLGGWFIVNGFKKRFYFEVILDNDKRKFPLDKNPDKSELQNFIGMASKLGYVIDAKLLGKINLQEKL